MSGSNPIADLIENMAAQLERQEKIIADLQAELAAARQEIERLKAELDETKE